MRFVYGKQELCTRQRAEDVSVLLTNGLGGYLSTTAAFSAPRCDQGLLAAAVQAPNRRVMLVHRLKEVLRIGRRRPSSRPRVLPKKRQRTAGKTSAALPINIRPAGGITSAA